MPSYSQPRLEGTNNVLLTNDVIAAEALRLLKNNLVAARLVHRDLEKNYGEIGDTVNVKLPFRTKVANGRTLVVQPMVDATTTLVINTQKHVGLRFTINDRSLSLKQFSERYLKSGMVALAHQVDLSILTELKNGGFYSSGTPGTALTTDNFTDASAYMEMVGVPMDGMCRAMYAPLDRAAVTKELKDSPNEALAGGAVRKNYDGTLSEIDMYSSAQMPVHTTGAHGGTPLVNGASQSGASLVTDGWTTSTAVIKKGDIFTLAGVYEINPQTYESTGRLMRFVATADGTSDGSGNLTIAISPSINSGAQTTLDKDGNSISTAAYQNVSALPADGAAITVIGTASTAYRQAVAWHRDACALAVINLHIPESANVAVRASDPESGLSLLMTAAYDISEFRETYRVDILYGVKAIYPELIHRIFSAAS